MFQINWKLKCFIYWILYFLSLRKILFYIQKKITKRSYSSIGEMFYSYKMHFNSLKIHKCKKILEFGAGKSLEQNIYLSLKFNNKIRQIVIDLYKMIDFNLVNFAKDQLQKKLKINFKLKNIKNLTDLKKIFNIEYYAPLNIIDLKEKKFDAIISTNVIEHIPKKNLEIILDKFRKIIKKQGILSFLIDYSDHYAHTDMNINSVNFLKYSDQEFKKYNTPLLFQNRLRHYDYINIFKNKKFRILKTIKGPKKDKINLISSEFKKKHKDLFVAWGYFLLKRI